STSFANASMAAAAGWTADKVLNAAYANRAYCGVDTPLLCEYKRSRPAVAIIMFGTNDSGSGSTGAFEDNMRQIIQTSLDLGVIPVLSTIPPKTMGEAQAARVTVFNQSIRALAQQYAIPLIDYYATMVNLPNQGMSSDGLHPSVPPDGGTCIFTPVNLQYGYTMRNLTTLQALDVIWRLYLA
ncbi:MAG TPA: GDSL-type esterase/lipase family protein, partial [Aggregatilineales bacterium]|nr:GDSL-type esterase/lipase family protein [Aggregatilineales bacterium]